MTVSSLAVANEFIIIDRNSGGLGVDHLKLQKLDYCAYGWWLVYHNEPAIAERPQVWKLGPVFPSLYHELKVYGMRPIKEPVSNQPFQEAPRVDRESELYKLIQWIWSRYGHLSGKALSEMTHRPGSAWRKVAQQYNFVVPANFRLSDADVREEFTGILQKMNSEAGVA